ncbi:MAG: hypothetical protein AAFQ87_13235 [Bacteroidota bacterium]
MKSLFSISSRNIKVLGPFLLGLVLRLAYGFLLGEGLFGGDAIYYVEEAQLLLDTGETSLYWPPALIYLLAAWGAIFGLSWGTGMAFMLLWYAVLMYLLWRLRLPVFFQYLFACYPVMIHHSVAVLTHLPVAVCVLGMFALLREAVGLRRGWWTGLLLGLATLLRAGSGVLLLGLLLRRTPGFIGGLLLGTTLLVGAWLCVASSQADRFVPVNTANAYNLYLGNTPWTPDYKSWWLGTHNETENPEFADFYVERDSILGLAPAARDQAFREAGKTYLLDEPGRFVYRFWQRVKVFWAFDTYTAAILQTRSQAFAAGVQLIECLCYGLLWMSFFLAWWQKRLQSSYLLAWLAWYMLPYLFAFAHPTYHLPLLPLLAVMASQVEWRWKVKKISWRETIWGICVLCWCYVQIEWGLSLVLS